jgi:syntaxin-binding protein 1
MHMREAIDKLMADFNKFIQDNAGFKGYAVYAVLVLLNVHLFNREGAANLNDMKDMLANLPQYQEQREKVGFVFERNNKLEFDVHPSSRFI